MKTILTTIALVASLAGAASANPDVYNSPNPVLDNGLVWENQEWATGYLNQLDDYRLLNGLGLTQIAMQNAIEASSIIQSAIYHGRDLTARHDQLVAAGMSATDATALINEKIRLKERFIEVAGFRNITETELYNSMNHHTGGDGWYVQYAEFAYVNADYFGRASRRQDIIDWALTFAVPYDEWQANFVNN